MTILLFAFIIVFMSQVETYDKPSIKRTIVPIKKPEKKKPDGLVVPPSPTKKQDDETITTITMTSSVKGETDDSSGETSNNGDNEKSPLTPPPPLRRIKTKAPPEKASDDETGQAIIKTRTRIKKNYEHNQRYYDKIANYSKKTEDEEESNTTTETEEMTEIDITKDNSFLRRATNFPEEERTKTDIIKDKLMSVTHTALNNVQDDLMGLMENKKRLKRKAAVGGIGGMFIFIAVMVLVLIVHKL